MNTPPWPGFLTQMYSSGFPENLFSAVTHASGRPRAQRSQTVKIPVTSPTTEPTNVRAPINVTYPPRPWQDRLDNDGSLPRSPVFSPAVGRAPNPRTAL